MNDDLILRLRAALRDRDGDAARLDDLIDELGASTLKGGIDHADADSLTLGKRELAELLIAVTKPKSFGEALREQGFRPAVGAKIAEREIHPRVAGPLKRYVPE